MKRSLLFVALVAIGLSACGKKEEKTVPPPAPTTTSPAPAPMAEPPKSDAGSPSSGAAGTGMSGSGSATSPTSAMTPTPGPGQVPDNKPDEMKVSGRTLRRYLLRATRFAGRSNRGRLNGATRGGAPEGANRKPRAQRRERTAAFSKGLFSD